MSWITPTLATVVALILLACSACDGNPTSPANENTWHQCPQGGWCPNWTDCPPIGYEKNGCETVVNIGPGDGNGSGIDFARKRVGGRDGGR